ncbi:MAG: serine hydrolase [bacterium]|nr:serine hydrolase [bacterium]
MVPAPPSQVTLPAFSISIAPPAVNISIEDHMSASGVIILDAQSGQQVYARQATVRRPMASLTKLMTALLIVENHDLDELVVITKEAESVEGNKAYLKPGESFTVGDLLSALLIASANDAAEALAVYHSGSVPEFVAEMNTRAKTLGLPATSFMNPAGLDHPRQWSTPQDIAWLTTFAMRYDEISKRMSKRGAYILSKEGTRVDLAHTHWLMHQNTSVTAGKTGTTDAAGQCLVSFVEEEGHSYIVVLMNSQQRYKDMNAILDVLDPGVEVAKLEE